MAPAAAESASPIGIANLPNQRHKIVAKRGAAFTIMVRRISKGDNYNLEKILTVVSRI